MAQEKTPTKYTVITPDRLYKGKSYAGLAADWFNWFLSADSDIHNLGSVVFLRSKGMPRSKVGHGGSEVADNPNYPAADDGHYFQYVNEPNVKVGPESLQIYTDQAIFVPIIVAYAEASKPYDDWGTMQEYTGLTIENGDHPPNFDQITIDGEPLKIENRNIDLSDYRIASSVFPAVIADTAYGRSVKDFLEMPLAPGTYPTIVDGYFVLIRFNEPGSYMVHSFASAGREIRGAYFSQLLYQIVVEVRPETETIQDGRGFHDLAVTRHRGVPGFMLRRDEKIISEIIFEQLKNGEISKKEMDLIAKPLSKILKLDLIKNYRDFLRDTRGEGSNDKNIFVGRRTGRHTRSAPKK